MSEEIKAENDITETNKKDNKKNNDNKGPIHLTYKLGEAMKDLFPIDSTNFNFKEDVK